MLASGNGAVVSCELHDGEQCVIFYVEVKFMVIEKLVLLHTLQFYALEAEVTHTCLMFLTEEGVEDHAIDEALRLVHLLLAAVELHAYLLLALVDLLAEIVHRLLEYLEDVDSSVEVSYFAAHCDQHGAHENPHFLLHFLGLYERHVEVHLLELQRILGVLFSVGFSSLIRGGLVMP